MDTKTEDTDFEVVDRSETSVKYLLAGFKQPEIDSKHAIFVSHADMQFKFSPEILTKASEFNPKPHFGYTMGSSAFWSAMEKWVQNRYKSQAVINGSNTSSFANMIAVINAAILSSTEPGDHILTPQPAFYRFITTAKNLNRVVVDYKLQTKDNRLHFNFEKLEEQFRDNKIKLMIFTNPFNPSGRIWSKEELTILKDLVIKYKVMLFSDEIFSDSIEPTQTQKEKGLTVKDIFTSMLSFEDLHPYLIYGCSMSKAFNCSGNSLAYCICNNAQIHSKILAYCDLNGLWPVNTSYYLLQACYSTKQANEWRIKAINYVFENFQYFKNRCAEIFPKLIIYPMESSYMVMVDFCEYKIVGKQLENAFTRINVCPTFLSNSFAVDDLHCSLVRINLGINKKVLEDMMNRLEKLFPQEK